MKPGYQTLMSVAERHNMSKTPTYWAWQSMKRRCNDQSHPRYPDWGGRGITICPRWSLFTNFLADMGVKPEGTRLDRIDNDGNYEPGNCRWATPKESAVNRRKRKSRTEQPKGE